MAVGIGEMSLGASDMRPEEVVLIEILGAMIQAIIARDSASKDRPQDAFKGLSERYTSESNHAGPAVLAEFRRAALSGIVHREE